MNTEKRPAEKAGQASILLFLALFLSFPTIADELRCVPGHDVSRSAAAAVETCADFTSCIDAGLSSVDSAPTAAIEAFKRAITHAEADPTRLGDAYTCIARAYGSKDDALASTVYFEAARKKLGIANPWLEGQYKQLIARQLTKDQAAIEREVRLKQELARTESESLMTVASSDEGADQSPGENEVDVCGPSGKCRGIGMSIASLEPTDKFRPKPAPAKKQVRHGTRPIAQEPVFSSGPSLDLRINFDYRSAALTSSGELQASELGKALEKLVGEKKSARVVLTGHTDLVGGEQYNRNLSKARAQTVKSYLSTHYPELASQIVAEGLGKRQPLYFTMDEESQRLNRRVEVQIHE